MGGKKWAASVVKSGRHQWATLVLFLQWVAIAHSGRGMGSEKWEVKRVLFRQF